ncbi:MAG TPA: ABC transporter substrate-binding protein, partial [Clostridiaceae bacterium]|nr:ABC transporter substrate-binding protein [Clostridiaceae bacterium]
MMKKFIGKLLTVILTGAVVLTGCGQKAQNTALKNNASSGQNQTQKNTATYPMTIKDDAGRTVVLQKKPEKIIALGSLMNALYDAGGKSIARCDSSSSDPLPEGTENLPTVGKSYNINMEKLISLQPDLVISQVGIHDKYTSVLETNKIPVIVLQMKTYDDIIQKFKLLGDLCGTSEKVNELIGNMKQKTDDVVSKLPPSPKKVLILYVTSQDVSVKLDNSIAGNVSQVLKLKNIASGTKPEKMG